MASSISQNGSLGGMNVSANQQQHSQNSMLSPGAGSQDSHDTLTEKLVNEIQVRDYDILTCLFFFCKAQFVLLIFAHFLTRDSNFSFFLSWVCFCFCCEWRKSLENISVKFELST